jgi:hypothetical protein
VLETALKHSGLSLGYDAIMGLCGLAFRTPPWPDPPAVTAEEAFEAIEAISASLSDCLTVLGAEAASDAERVLDIVETSVSDRRPCMALGWGSDKERWSIIAGYDRGKHRLIGHSLLDAPRDQYESWPPDVDLLVAITSVPRPRGPDAISAALQSGAQRWENEGAERYERWLNEVTLPDAAPRARHERAVELLADSRAAAAGFAEQVAEHERETPAAWLSRAAGHWREAARLLEARGVPGSREATEALETLEGRADWAELLRMVADHEEHAAMAARLSATADYLPEEASPW